MFKRPGSLPCPGPLKSFRPFKAFTGLKLLHNGLPLVEARERISSNWWKVITVIIAMKNYGCSSFISSNGSHIKLAISWIMAMKLCCIKGWLPLEVLTYLDLANFPFLFLMEWV